MIALGYKGFSVTLSQDIESTRFDDVLRLVSGITSAAYVDDAQRDRVLEVALSGLRVIQDGN